MVLGDSVDVTPLRGNVPSRRLLWEVEASECPPKSGVFSCDASGYVPLGPRIALPA